MAKVTAAFYELPPWFEQIQRQLNAMTEPLQLLKQESVIAAQNIAMALDSPAIRQWNKIAELCKPGMLDMIQQTQAIFQQVAPIVELQSQLYAQIPEWTRSIFDNLSYEYKEQRLSQLVDAANQIASAPESVETLSDEVSNLSDEEQHIVADEITAILADKKNWDQRFMECVHKFKDTHPTIASVLINFFLPLLIAIIANLISTRIGQIISPAKVYEEPASTSQVIYHIEQNQTVIIIGDAPYYYEVEIRDSKSEQSLTGYISKRSITISENDESNQNILQNQ